MTQKEKQLLLKDISARLPYKVKCSITKKGVVRELKPMDNGINIPVNQVCDITLKKTLNTDIINDFDNDNIVLKPYLRPMDSMTEGEIKELSIILNYEFYVDDDFALVAEDDRHRIRLELCEGYIDWLNTHHFDFRGLIEKGLALEAPNNMYKN